MCASHSLAGKSGKGEMQLCAALKQCLLTHLLYVSDVENKLMPTSKYECIHFRWDQSCDGRVESSVAVFQYDRKVSPGGDIAPKTLMGRPLKCQGINLQGKEFRKRPQQLGHGRLCILRFSVVAVS